MLHPLFSTLIQRPDLVVDHVSAYVDLIGQETAQIGSDLVHRAVAWVVAGVCALLFLVFAGVALMLGMVTQQFHWILVAVPGVMLLLTAVAYGRAKTAIPSERFPELKSQIKSDTQALRAS
ncbi:MAG: phage holin family protein [Pseudomonadota bacterium]